MPITINMATRDWLILEPEESVKMRTTRKIPENISLSLTSILSFTLYTETLNENNFFTRQGISLFH
ncbi:MAG: hypothetical protein DCC43_11465 [Candidatus Brocadia sp.]|jgi:hypothetical protein|nr:hypothetical protein [Candidatus Brocadia sp. AMX3]OQZ01908.1 MAG: hypothetical protein B6D35_02110 [Candidatus Brocadia sp. UTAMX2]RIJ95715.1 MAG: hypothetical protein DCC43_11465 [Candidatus Brocadia sp.]